MRDIFISYASEDRPWAEMLAQTLNGRGWSTFWDRTIPIGKTWRETIGRELKDARCVIVLWSKTSIESGWVQEEADDAKRRGVLVPILIENVQPPIGFRSIQAAHLENWDSTEPTEPFGRLVADIVALIGLPPKEAEKEGRQAEAEVERKADRGHKRAKTEARPKAAEEAGGEKDKREPPSAPLSQEALRSAMPELREQLEHVSSKQPKTTAVSSTVPWRIIAGSAIILSVSAVLAVWRFGPLVTPKPAPPVTSQDASAMYSQGERYYTGQGVAQDYTKAREWYEKAADKGNVDAIFSLGVLYANGLGGVQDYAKAREWFEEAAAKGNANAMYNLGKLYDYGHGVAQDYAKAREWYEKAAAKDNAAAMVNLGVLYANGQGAAQDYAKAREWFERAAAKGNANAMYNLGVLYDHGQGVTQDNAKAREWYEKAADKGDPDAKAHLGQLLIR